MINLILLAAGLSCRFGENKLLYEIEGKQMYRHMLDQALAFQEQCKREETQVRLILVTAYEEIESYACTKVGFCSPYAEERGRILIHNGEPEAGISRSAILGLSQAELQKDDDCVMFAVCDQPWLRAEDMMLLLKQFTMSGKGIGGLAFQETMGNPVIFKKKYGKELLTLTGDEGGKKVVKGHLDDTFFCEISSPKALCDIDRKEEGMNV